MLQSFSLSGSRALTIASPFEVTFAVQNSGSPNPALNKTVVNGAIQTHDTLVLSLDYRSYQPGHQLATSV